MGLRDSQRAAGQLQSTPGCRMLSGSVGFRLLKPVREGTLRNSLVLKEAYLEITKVVERFGRIHHHVDYRKYKKMH
jgi:hypothetical protein